MAEPQVRYCTTTDGVSIAYYAMGEGPTVIDMGQPPTHIQMEWRIEPVRNWYQRFAQHHQFVRFDTRGTGLSERQVRSYSVDTQVTDLDAVVRALNVPRVTLMGAINSSAAAMKFAASRADRVEHLILWCPYSRGEEFFANEGTRSLRDMIHRDWHMMTETASRSRFSWNADVHAREYAALFRAAIEPDMQARLMDSLATLDVTDCLADIHAPTLVLQREDRGADVARRIAAAIPNATVTLLSGGSAAMYLDDADVVWRTVAQFLGDPDDLPKQQAASQPRAASGLQTILFTDIEANTELLQRVGDTAWRDVLREHERRTRALLAEHGGTEIKTIGDAFMTSFNSASAAIECAIALQRDIDHDPAQLHAPLRIRIGINAGEPIVEDAPDGRGDLFGTAVTTAARVQSMAKGGEILVTDVVRQLVAGKGFLFEDRGEQTLRGFDDPVRIFAVRIGD